MNLKDRWRLSYTQFAANIGPSVYNAAMTDAEIPQAWLVRFPNWRNDGDAIIKTFAEQFAK